MPEAKRATESGVVFHRLPADSELAIVAFSSRAARNGRFDLFRLQEHVPARSVLLVRDPHLNWYNSGLPGVGETPAEIAEEIHEEVVALGASRTMTVGSSMGGYAAILFGCLIEAERVLALAPQTLLDPRFELSPPADVRLQAPDLLPYLREAPRTRLDLVAGWDDLMDVFHAQRVAGLPSVRVMALREGRHTFVSELRREGAFWPFLTKLIDGRVPEGCEVEPRHSGEERERIAAAAFAFADENWEALGAALHPLVEASASWAGPSLYLALSQIKLGDLGAADLTLRTTIERRPGWDLPRRLRARCLLGLGLDAAAKAEWRRARELNPRIVKSLTPFEASA